MLGEDEEARDAERQALERINKALQLNPKDSRAFVLGGIAHIKLGDPQTGIAWGLRALEADPESSGAMYNVACIYALAGESEIALDYLEQAVDCGARNKRIYETDKDLDSLRDHPRFKTLIERI